jgi:hypothetical protein
MPSSDITGKTGSDHLFRYAKRRIEIRKNCCYRQEMASRLTERLSEDSLQANWWEEYLFLLKQSL